MPKPGKSYCSTGKSFPPAATERYRDYRPSLTYLYLALSIGDTGVLQNRLESGNSLGEQFGPVTPPVGPPPSKWGSSVAKPR